VSSSLSEHNSHPGHSIWYTHVRGNEIDSSTPPGHGLSHRPTGPAHDAQAEPRFDYTTVGHVTADVMPDGSLRAGGSAFYSALQAARLGQRALIVTRGVAAEIERLLEPYRAEIALEILPAQQTTTLQSTGEGATRRQRVLAWAGAIGEDVAVDCSIVHLAPVARETPARWRGRADFIGLTPQGLIRAWSGPGDEVSPTPLDPSLVPEHCQAVVFNEAERECCAWLIKAGEAADATQPRPAGGSPRVDGRHRAVVAITDAAAATVVHLSEGGMARVEVPAIEEFVDDVGAGDVFAAAFFIALRDGKAPQAAAAFANAAAAVRIAGYGADAIGGRTAIEARFRAVA
jgi:sugar/nucleoside kinase (ribokinase family)